jgi:hypothetical protein
MSQNVITAGGTPWYRTVGWGFYLTVLTVSALSFLYFHELGFFTRYRIPIEFIRIELLDSIQYIPAFVLAVTLFFFLFSLFGGIEVAGHIYKIRKRIIGVIFFLLLGLLLPALGLQKRITFLIFLVPLAMEFFPRVENGYHELDRFKIKHALSVAMLIFTMVCTISFYLGFLERFTLDKSKVFKKVSTNQTLLRRYEDIAIYCAPDSTYSSTNKQLIIISYNGNKNDTLIWIDQ